MSDVLLEVQNLARHYGPVRAVDNVDLTVRQGEVFALLGPSGSGKTTCLRMVAGLEPLDGGRIQMGGQVLADASIGRSLPAERRNIAMVFQSYAIWPHLTVAGNVGFPLRMRGVRRARRRELVEEILEITGMRELIDRRANQLSGGQQQRVALARALVYRPQLLLLDEPLSNLDAKLRLQMRRELRRLNRELDVSMLFVTHDHDEAFGLADRIAVLCDGQVQQIGTPAELYERPATPFVRDFLGRRLILPGRVERSGPTARIRLDDPALGQSWIETEQDLSGFADRAEVSVHTRPEDVEMTAPPGDGAGPGPNQVRATLLTTAYLGNRIEYVADVGGRETVLIGGRHRPRSAGDEVFLQLDPQAVTVWSR